MGYKQVRRQHIDILLEILQNAREPIPSTKLSGMCNLNYTLLREMTTFLIKKGFLENLPSPRKSRRGPAGEKDGGVIHLHVITAKGNQLLLLTNRGLLGELLEYGREVQVEIEAEEPSEEPPKEIPEPEEPEEKTRKPPPLVPAVEQEYVEPCLYGLDFPFQDLEICADCEHYREQYKPNRCKWPDWKKIGWEEENQKVNA